MPENITLDDLRTATPTAATATPGSAVAPAEYGASDAVASRAGTTDAAAASGASTGYSASTGVVDPETMTAAGQMTSITGQDSPLMRRAAEEGMLQAGRRGLQNSSIAAGTATGAMVDRATPLAQQDAATSYGNMRANIDAENRASEISTGRETEATFQNVAAENAFSMENARAANEMAALNAQLETAVSQGNADAANRIKAQIADAEARASLVNAEMTTQTNISNAASQNAMIAETQRGNQELNRQYLAGTQAMDLAAIQGRYQQLISSNQAAASLYNSYLTSIGQAMANHEVTPDRVAQYINVMANQMEGSLEMIDAMNALDLGTIEVPGASGTGSGATSDIAPAGGNAPPPPPPPVYPGGGSVNPYDPYTWGQR